MLTARPIERKAANAFVDALHRHHCHTVGDKCRIACYDGERLVGVAQLGRPVARALDDGMTIEVLRLCTDGTRNACSFLYGRAARIVRELGYTKVITYILISESGSSLRAAGWHKEAETRGGSWNCPSRPRDTKAPTGPKQR